jgi:signal transduction histidine kinase
MIRRPRLSLRNKLALVIFAITAAAFGVLYFGVVPQLEANLEERRLDDLRDQATAARPTLQVLLGDDVPAPALDRRVRAAADATDARVTLLDTQDSQVGPQGQAREVRVYPLSDSRENPEQVPTNEALVRRAIRTGRQQSGFTTFEGRQLGQVAQPLRENDQIAWVALYSRDLDDVAETVSFIRQRLLIATAAALLLALLGGYLVARRLARRVRRVEEAAKKVARGRFIDPLPVDSEDELGQLTRTFNTMQDQLRRVDAARKDFIATASHELRTPIFSLAGFVELLQDEELDPETRQEFLDTMAEQVARLQKLSVDLLDLSRLDAGSIQLQTEPVDLSELARSVVHEFTPALGTHELEVDLPDRGPQARCDRERVAQIMRILLDNALRHTPEGTHVTVRADRQNGAAELTVADAGPGMTEAAQSQAFERFYTGDAARGAGLGLAIARELAERMEGRLALSSAPGATSFTLRLPTGRDGA